MPPVTKKMTDSKDEILAKLVETFREFKSDFNEIKDQIENKLGKLLELK